MSVQFAFEVIEAGDDDRGRTSVRLAPVIDLSKTPLQECEIFCTRETAAWFAARLFRRVIVTVEEETT